MKLVVKIGIVILAILMRVSTVYADGSKLTFQGELGYPPYTYEKDGYLTGFDMDLTNLIFKSTDYDVRYSTDSWDKVYSRVKNGEIDTCGLLAVNEQREKDILFSKPVSHFYIAIFTRNGFEKVNVDNLTKFKVGLGKGQFSEYIYKEKVGASNYKTYNTLQEALEGLNKGEIDVLFENQEVINYLVIHNALSGKIISQQKYLFPTEVAYGVTKTNQQLVEYINQRLDELIHSGVYEELYQKYFFTHSEIYQKERKVNTMIFISVIILAIIFSHVFLRLYIKRLKKKIIGEQEFSENVLRTSDVFVIAYKMDGTILKYNKHAEAITGCNAQEVLGKVYTSACKDCYKCRQVINLYEDIKKGILNESKEVNIVGVNNKEFTFIVKSTILNNEKGKVHSVFFIGVDVSERRELQEKLQYSYEELTAAHEELVTSEEELQKQFEMSLVHQERLSESEERFRLASEGSNDIIWDADMKTNKFYVSDRWSEMLGYKNNEITDDEAEQFIIHPDDIERRRQARAEHFIGKTPYYSCEYRIKANNGEYRWFYSRGKVLSGDEGKVIRFSGSLSDITDRKENEIKLQNSYQEMEAIYEELYATQEELTKQYEELKLYEDKLHEMAYNDYLTGLPNRMALYEDLERHLEKYPDTNKALFFIDSDNFKFLNDTLGHFYGDLLITDIGKRLFSTFESDHAVYRFGGDEFIVCLYNYVNLEEVEQSALKISQCFKKPLNVGNSMFHTTASIGIALFPEHGVSADELLKCADIAMYKAKESGKNRFVFYSPSMNKAVNERMVIERHLRSALDNNEFLIYYQPQLDIKTNKISGFEALIRWQSKELGFVSPQKFIKVAEDTHLIIPFGEWVLRNACLFIKSIHKQGYTDITMSVNISMLQLLQEDFVDRVMQVVEFVDLDPQYLELEITESILMESYEAIGSKLEQLRTKGVKIALDDFGQGYSSLSYLKQLPITTLKIDKIFVDSILEENSEKSLTDMIVKIGRKMGLTVLAEGVETQEQLEYLKKHDCHKIQGYFFSKPLPQEEAERLVKSIGKI